MNFVRAAVIALCAATLVAIAAHAQTPPPVIYEPEYGQPGKDVIWVPTPDIVVETMIDLAKVTADDYVIDLGSGDGRLVIAAAKRGARALGMEYNGNLVRYSIREAQKQGVADKAQFLEADIFASDFSSASVLTLFLLPEMNLRLRPQFLAMKPGTRIVANYFGIGDWSSDEAVHVPESEKCDTYCVAYLWIVPARVDGVWQTPQGELTLVQGHQYFKGTLGIAQVTQGRVRGNTLNFTIEGVSYSGRISGDSIEGVAGTKGARWTAKRKLP
ncbi:MAG: class I SAM-dependent methyltransferase [Burkholderiales bacterium]